MTVELFHLCIYGLVIVGATLVQQLTSIFNVGLMPVFGSREGINFTGMTGRLERAILNCAIAMALIVPWKCRALIPYLQHRSSYGQGLLILFHMESE